MVKSRARSLSVQEHARLVEEFMAEGMERPDAQLAAREEQRKYLSERLATGTLKDLDRD